LKNEEFVQI